MINIRNSVFETNSSSSHSLVFSKKNRGYSYDLPVDENGVLVIPYGEFGWGPDILKTPIEKLSYLITDHGGIDDDIIEMIKTKCPKVKEVETEPVDSYWPEGYVDHESVGTSRGVSPEELVFNNSIIVIIDNDNSCYFYDIKHSDNDDEIEALFDKSVKEVLDIARNNHYYW